MRIAGTVYPAFNGYDDMAFEIYLSGCNQHCPGCHNPEMQSFELGDEWGEVFEGLIDEIDRAEWSKYISILGGEPLDQEPYELMHFVVALKARYKDKKFMMFTGHEFDDIPAWCFDMFDVIKHGRYDETQKTNTFPASTNQGIWRKASGGITKDEVPTQ